MRIEILSASLENHVELRYDRSSGPGGQNVNKSSTKVRARIDLAALEGLSAAEAQRVRQLLAKRIDADGGLYVAVDEERIRSINQTIAVNRLLALIIKAAKLPKTRIATKPSAAERERRLKKKKVKSQRKAERRPPENE